MVSQRIGHADVGFFLQTYAHVLGSEDRDAAEQAAAFLIGEAGIRPDDRSMMSEPNVPKHVPSDMKTAPGDLSGGRFTW